MKKLTQGIVRRTCGRDTAQRDMVKARYDTLFQGLKLKAAAGVLTGEDVVAVNALLAH